MPRKKQPKAKEIAEAKREARRMVKEVSEPVMEGFEVVKTADREAILGDGVVPVITERENNVAHITVDGNSFHTVNGEGCKGCDLYLYCIRHVFRNRNTVPCVRYKDYKKEKYPLGKIFKRDE